MNYPSTGRFTWHELKTGDPVAATSFYAALFGWTVEETPAGPMGVYRVLKLGQEVVAGAMQSPPGVPPHWMPYVSVVDADASAREVSANGGTIMVPPTTVPDMLRFSVASDADGAVLGLMQPMGGGENQAPYDGPDRSGTFVWDELHVRDFAGAKMFYGALFGWGGKADDKIAYYHWTLGETPVGGMSSHMGGEGVPPHWLAYVGVDDVVATAKKVETLGGKVRLPPMDLPGVGKLAVVQDPLGATFALFRSARLV